MLLRRVIEHVRNQNWTAVTLDFMIVVVGVFIGIQVANWNEDLSAQQRVKGYLSRLALDMKINQSTLNSRKTSYESQIENGLFAIEATTKPENQEDAWRLIRSFFQVSHAFTIILQRGTYDEIINSGDLALLNNQELVNALSDFYTFAGLSTINVIPVYRENVRRIIPFELQKYLQAECYEISMPDSHKLIDCEAPRNASNLINLAGELQSNSELKLDLQYMLSFAGVSIDIAHNRMTRAEGVLKLIEKQQK